MRCFGEYLAECAGDGVELDAPVPRRRRAGRFERIRDYTLAGAAADGARGDPATSIPDRNEESGAELHETKTAPANSHFPA